MPGTLDLSAPPLTLIVSLTRGADFVRKILPKNEDGTSATFADGTQIALVFDTGDSWPATVTPTDASWNVDVLVNDALMTKGPSAVRLVYTAGAVDMVWAMGAVVLYG